MFGAQAPTLVQQLIDAGMDHQQAQIIGDNIGQCRARLEHRGFVGMYGPTMLADPVTMNQQVVNNDGDVIVNQGGAVLFGGQPVEYYTNLISTTAAAGKMKVFTLAADLDSGDTVVVSGTTHHGDFIRPSYKLASGTFVGSIQADDDNWYILAWNDCEQPQ